MATTRRSKSKRKTTAKTRSKRTAKTRRQPARATARTARKPVRARRSKTARKDDNQGVLSGVGEMLNKAARKTKRAARKVTAEVKEMLPI